MRHDSALVVAFGGIGGYWAAPMKERRLRIAGMAFVWCVSVGNKRCGYWPDWPATRGGEGRVPLGLIDEIN